MEIEVETKDSTQLKEPKLFLVFMLNDHYTSWDFCLRIITSTFHKTVDEANEITQQIHTKGKGLCGLYSYEIAETKANIVRVQARKEGFPMTCSVEEE